MKELSSVQRLLIEKYIDYIDENTRESWEDLYDDLDSHYSPHITRKFTEAMLTADINPLDKLVYVPANYLHGSILPTKLIIPDNIKLIGEGAFEYCENLTEITLPKSLTSIKEYVFYGCKNLTTIRYLGTVEDWKYKVYIEEFAGDKQTQFQLCPTDKIICSDGSIDIKNKGMYEY